MTTIALKPLYYRGKETMGLFYPHQKATDDLVKRIKHIQWNQAHKCWYLPLTKEYYLHLKEALNGKALIDHTGLMQYLQQRKVHTAVTSTHKVTGVKAQQMLHSPLNEANLQAFSQFQQLLQLKGYSPNTIKTYTTEFHVLLRLLGPSLYKGSYQETHRIISSLADQNQRLQ